MKAASIERTARESLDCALASARAGTRWALTSIITFDAHDPRVQNAIPLNGFETVQAYLSVHQKPAAHRARPYRLIPDHLMVISPDEGGMGRAIYIANVLGLDMGMFYKRRDYSQQLLTDETRSLLTNSSGTSVARQGYDHHR